MRIVALIFAVVSGLLILAGYFVSPLRDVQSILLSWAIILAGTATIVGIFSLIRVHGTRIRNREQGSNYSAILMVCLFATFIFGLVLGPDSIHMRRLLMTVVVPAESALMALLAVSLIYASIRLLRRRANLMSATFLATAMLMLVASATLPFGELAGLNTLVRPWFQHVVALGGARGLLIGVALGTLVTGVRVLIGADRPYEGG